MHEAHRKAERLGDLGSVLVRPDAIGRHVLEHEAWPAASDSWRRALASASKLAASCPAAARSGTVDAAASTTARIRISFTERAYVRVHWRTLAQSKLLLPEITIRPPV